jgi:peptidoglycan/LPS O-acetylase OafA/YrhL
VTFTKRVVATTLTAVTLWICGSPVAAAAAESTGSDTTRSMLYAGIAGLAVGGLIAFWQSRKRRRNGDGERDD